MADKETGFNLEFDKSNTEPPKTNYLNTAFNEHQRLFDSAGELGVHQFELKVRMYLSLIRKEHREPILNNIKVNFKKHLEEYERGDKDYGIEPKKADPKDKDYLRTVALTDAVAEGGDYFSRYHNADGNELGVSVCGILGFDEDGNGYMQYDADRKIKELKALMEKQLKNPDALKKNAVKIESNIED